MKITFVNEESFELGREGNVLVMFSWVVVVFSRKGPVVSEVRSRDLKAPWTELSINCA